MAPWIGRTNAIGALAAAAVLAGCQPPAATAPDPVATWAAAPPLRHPRAAHAVVSTDDAIYTVAGTGDGLPVPEVERFDGASWADETRLPGPGLNAPAAVALDGKLYVIGGFETVSNSPSAGVQVYDLGTKRWGAAAPLPAPRGGHAAVALGGLIHVIGGGNSRSTIADHSVYDAAADRWTERAPLPHAEGSPAAVAFRGKLYAIGGRSGTRDFGDVFVYDPAADAWSEGPRIEPRATCGAVVYRDALYLLGGESQSGSCVLADVLRLSGSATAWEPAAPLPTARGFARAVTFRGAIYVVGGSAGPQTDHAPPGTGVVERFTP